MVFLVLAECRSAKIFSSSFSDKLGKRACCPSFSLLLARLLAGRSKAKEKFGWSSIYLLLSESLTKRSAHLRLDENFAAETETAHVILLSTAVRT